VYFNQLSYFLSASFSKLCFLFMFLRIFPAKRTRKFVYIGIVLSVLFPIAFGLPMVFACRPISGALFVLQTYLCLDDGSLTSYVVTGAWTSWDAETPVDYCINQFVFWFVACGLQHLRRHLHRRDSNSRTA
jgi:hypothetical protein